MPDAAMHIEVSAGVRSSAGARLAMLGAARITTAGGLIARVEPAAGVANGLFALPAPANAHDHGRGLRTLAFGAVDDALEIWLHSLSREPKLPAYHRAAVAFARMAEGGVAVANHSHGAQDEAGLLQEAQEVARAAGDVGIRVAFAAPFTDRNRLAYGDQAAFIAAAGPALGKRLEGPSGIKPYLRLTEEIAQLSGANFSVQYCPVGPQWVSDASLAAIAEASALNGRRIHMHLLETRFQREWSDHAYPGGIISHLDRIGLLSPRLSVAHGVYLRAAECELLAARGVIVSVNTSSNFRLRSGIAPVASFLKSGLAFGLGLDAQPLDDDDDMLREMRLAYLNHRGFALEDGLSAAGLFEAAMVHGRRAVLGPDGGGRLEAGAPADILVLDYAAMTPDVVDDALDPVVALLTRATRKHIARLIVAGRTVVENGRCTRIDRPALEAELIDRAKAQWAKAPPDNKATLAMKHAARRFYGCGCHMGGTLDA